MAGTVLAFAALGFLCLFYAGLPQVQAGIAPLLAVCTAMLFFVPFGMLGLLVPGAWVFYLLCFALGGLALWRGRAALLKSLLAPGPLLFAAAGLGLMLLLALRGPDMRDWDEFSFWGTAVKLVKQQGVLYTGADVGWWWTQTQSPALVLLAWFCQFFSAGFTPWAVYWAYGMLYFACVAALLAPFSLARWRVALPLGLAGLLMPFVFSTCYHTVNLSTAYLSAYGDLPAGILLGGALALWFGPRLAGGDMPGARGGEAAPAGRAAPLWPALLPLAALALVKQNVLAVALVAAGVMAADLVFFGGVGGAKNPLATAGKRAALLRPGGLPRRLAGALALLAAPFAAYMGWSRYAGAVAAQNPNSGAGGTNIEPVTAVLMALEQLLRPAARSERFTAVLGTMGQNFAGRVMADGQVLEGSYNVSMLGSGVVTCGVILLVFLLAAVVAKGKTRGRVILAGALLPAGFAGYNLTLLASFAFMNKAAESAYGAPDYARYLGGYLPGWLMLAALLLALAPPPKSPRREWLAGAGVLVLCCGLLLRFAVLARPGYTLLDYPDRFYDEARAQAAVAARVQEKAGPNARVFFVCQGGNGLEWFQYSYHLLPVVLEESLTGGAGFTPPPAGLEDYDRRAWQSPRDILDYMAATGCDYLLIEALDEGFIENYGALFADKLAGWDGSPALYRLGAEGLLEPA